MFQHKYARELPKTFDMSKCNELLTPMEMNVKLSYDYHTPKIDSKQYQRTLIFLCNTRLDINFGIGILNRFANEPQ